MIACSLSGQHTLQMHETLALHLGIASSGNGDFFQLSINSNEKV